MTATERTRLERRAILLKSLAHPARLLMLELLEAGPLCVAELREAVGSDLSTVSKHLAVLRRAGLVRDRKRGTSRDYELACGCLSHFLDCLETGAEGEACQASAPKAMPASVESPTTRAT